MISATQFDTKKRLVCDDDDDDTNSNKNNSNALGSGNFTGKQQ